MRSRIDDDSPQLDLGNDSDDADFGLDLGNSFADPSLLPLRRLISRRHWKLSTVVLCALAIGVGLIQLGLMAELRVLPAEWAVFTPGFNSFVRFYVVSLLAVSAQISLLIAWVRSESPHDFAGRYRTWHWVAGVFGLSAIWAGTDLHLIVANAAAVHFPPAVLTAPQLYWLVPLSVVGFMLLAFLNREVASSSLSCACLWCATLSFGAAALIWCGLAGDLGWLPLTSSVMFGAFAVFTGVLFHARHVIYVSADSPARSEAPLRRAARRLIVGTKLSRRRRLQRRLAARAKRQAKAAAKAEAARLRQEAKEQAKADAEAAKLAKAEKRKKRREPEEEIVSTEDTGAQPEAAQTELDEQPGSQQPARQQPASRSKSSQRRTAKTAQDLANEAQELAEQETASKPTAETSPKGDAESEMDDSDCEPEDSASEQQPAKQSRRQRKRSKRKRAA